MSRGNEDSGDKLKHYKKIYEDAPYIVTFKEPEELKIIYANNAMRNFVGSTSLYEIQEKTDFDFRWEQFAPLYLRHEQDTLEGKNYVALYPGCDYQGVETLFICHRAIVTNDFGELDGVLTHTYILQDRKHLELSNLINTEINNATLEHFTVGKGNDEIYLTKREREVLFYFLRGKSCKEIGRILDISHRTVEVHVSTLKLKFRSNSKSELTAKAISVGFLYDIPTSLFHKNLADTLKE
ncbi:MAG: LuxR family transcriptional regulator [Gammaproteobacteria bacterium]|nr:LuxR family transcriptional regulator [Gammaproteobacteria bacterium]